MTEVNIVPYDTFDDGIEFKFRGIEPDENGEPVEGAQMINIKLIVPPLNLQNLKRVQKFVSLSMKQMKENALGPEGLISMAEILAPALSQNYRGVPRWLVEQSIKVDNLDQIFQAVMDLSGLKRKEIEEKKALAAMKPPDTAETTSTTSSSTSVSA